MKTKTIKKSLSTLLLSSCVLGVIAPSANVMADENEPYPYPSDILAFPGAEGGGRYTSGGREGEVFIVTNLDDNGDDKNPVPGSLRDAVSEDDRFIVFDVAGVIDLQSTLNLRKRKNITIAGQSAPGDGITIAGFETNMSDSENVIIRHLRFRPGVKNVLSSDSMDAIWGRSMRNVMIDHLSTSWGTDETMSLYRAENMTVQWSLVSESLTMSGHTKGRHGYGAIMGGVNTTYHHNLISTHTSRMPRFGGGTAEADDNDHLGTFDFRNNVIYNWGFNNTYGGGRANSNMINNYLKAGPGTRDEVANHIINAGEKDKPGNFHVSGNVLEGNTEVSDNNSLGITYGGGAKDWTTIDSPEFPMDGTTPEALRTTSAEDAYTEVLEKAGATAPKQDAVDGRLKKEVEQGKGRFINNEAEVGGYPVEEIYRDETEDTDRDGLPDSWEEENGLDPENSEDSMEINDEGYTYLEEYLNDIVADAEIPENPEIEITQPANNEIFSNDEKITIEAMVDDASDIAKVDFYDSTGHIGTQTESNGEDTYTFDTNLTDGTHFVTAMATDESGLETQATAVAVHVNTETETGDWKSVDIGEPAISGWLSLDNDQITVKGSGKISGTADNFQFANQEMYGDGEVVVKVDEMSPIDHHAFAGLMIREGLEAGDKAAALGVSFTKGYEYEETNPETGKVTKMYRNPFAAYLVGRSETNADFDEIDENLDSKKAGDESGIAMIEDVPMKDEAGNFQGYYLKLIRKGDTFEAYGSPNGKDDWEEIGSKEVPMNKKVYVGLAVDGNQVSNQLHNLNAAKFSDFSFKQEVNRESFDQLVTELEEKEREKEDYTKVSWEIYEQAKELKNSATQEEVTAQIEKLQEAFDSLVEIYELKDWFAQAEKKVDSNYTKASWQKYTKAKQLVKETIDNDSATQEEVDAAKEEMTKAEESLVDISELNQLIADSKEKAEKEYTSKSWKAFLEALDKAKSMVATEEATQQEVNDVYNTLEKAIKELEKKQAKAPTNPGKPNNSGNNKGKGRLPQTGEKDHSMVTIIGGITLLLVGVLSYMKHKVANKMQD